MKSYKQFLKEQKLTPDEAHRIFHKFGVDSRNKTGTELKSHYSKLMMKHHPDRGGSVTHAQEINSAWDTLKNSNPAPRASETPKNASSQSGETYHVYHYDGKGFSHWAPIKGTEHDFRDMARSALMADPNVRSKAVFIGKRDTPHSIKMVWANGKHLDRPVETMHQGTNGHPASDKNFVRTLSNWIDARA